MDWPGGSRQQPVAGRLGHWGLPLLAMKAWPALEPPRVPTAWQARRVRPGR
jgi:hypothetical protein